MTSGGISVPLTTLFTPPTTCNFWSAATWHIPEQYGVISTQYAYEKEQITLRCQPALQDDCLPQDLYHSQSSVPGGGITDVIFSPGVCPSGFSASGSTSRPDSPALTQFCCPTGNWKYGPISTGANSGENYCVYDYTGAWNVVGVRIHAKTIVLVDSAHNTRTDGVLIPFMTPLTVAWASSDLPNFTPASIAPASLPKSTTAPSKATSHPASAPTGGTNGGHSLSTGAKAGIGVGVSVAVLLVLGIFALLFVRRRKRQNTVDQPSMEPTVDPPEKDAQGHPVEIAEGGKAAHMSELSGSAKLMEVDSAQRHELPGDFRGIEKEGAGNHGHEANVESKK